VADNHLAFKQVKTHLAPPYLTASPKRLVWIHRWSVTRNSMKRERSTTKNCYSTSQNVNLFQIALLNGQQWLLLVVI